MRNDFYNCSNCSIKEGSAFLALLQCRGGDLSVLRSAEGSTALKSSQQQLSVMEEPLSVHGAELAFPIGVAVPLSGADCCAYSQTAGSCCQRSGGKERKTILQALSRGTIETVVSIETSSGARDAAELSLSSTKSLTVGRFRTSQGFCSFHQKEPGGLWAIKLPQHM